MRFGVMVYQSVRKGVCPVCGKSVTRKKNFEAMPWLRDYNQTRLVLFKMAEKWTPNFTHKGCLLKKVG